MLKKSAKRLLALLCTISIIITSLFVVEAEDTVADTQFTEYEESSMQYKMNQLVEKGYRVVTPLTFGVPDATAASYYKTTVGETISLDKLLFSANVTCTGNGYLYYLKGGPNNSDVGKLQFYGNSNIYFYNLFDYEGKSAVMYYGDSTEISRTYGSSAAASRFTLKPANFELETNFYTEFQIWITTEFVQAPQDTESEAKDDLKIGIWINGKLYDYNTEDEEAGTYFYVLNCKDLVYKGFVQRGATLATSSSIMELDHMGMVGGEYASVEGDFYDSTTSPTVVNQNSAKTESQLLANKIMDGTTFQSSVRFEGEGGTLYYGSKDEATAIKLTSTSNGIQVLYGDDTLGWITNDNVGINVLNNNFDLKLTTEVSDSDVNLDLCVNNKYASFILPDAADDLTATIGIRTEGDATVLVGDFASEEPEQITHDLDNGPYTITKTATMTRLSVNGVSVDGDIELNEPGTYSVAITENGKVSMIDVTIPDKFVEYESTEMESQMQTLIQDGYRVVTPLTFGMPDSATAGSASTSVGETISIDKLLFAANVTYTDATSTSNFHYLKGGTNGNSNTFQLIFQKSGNYIHFYNYFNYNATAETKKMYLGDDGVDSKTDAYWPLYYENADVDTFKEEELQIWFTTKFVKAPWLEEGEAEDDLKIGVWFNGKLYNNEYFYVLDCKDLIYKEYVSRGAKFATSSPIMELDHMGMVGGEYASADGVFKTSDLVASKVMNETTFQTGVRFEGEGGTLYYGAENAEDAIQLTSKAGGIQVTYGGDDIVFMNQANVGMDVLNKNFNLKLTTRDIDSNDDGEDDKLELDICVDNKHKSFELLGLTADLKAYVGVKTEGDATVLVGDFAEDTPQLEYWCLDNGKLHSVDKKASMTRMSVDGVATVTQLIDEPGTYSVVSTKSGQVYMEDKIVYRTYDLNDNNKIDVVDIVRMKKVEVATETTKEAAAIAALSPAGRKAMGYDESTWTVDKAQETLIATREALVKTVEIEVSTMTPLDEEVVYNYGFDFLGSTQVMPIGGFNGPVPSSSITANFEVPNYISDEYFGLIEECGVNLILHSDIDYNDAPTAVKSILKLGEKYGIGITVKDRRYGELGTDLTLDEAKNRAATYLSDYQSYKAFCGVFAVDEPETSDYYLDGTPEDTNLISKYATRINTLAKLGVWSYGNLLPYSKSKDESKELYPQYVTEWLNTCDVKMLMWDYYVHNSKGLEQSYFYNMSLGRQLANENSLPFWTYVQCGTQLAKGSNYSSTQIDADTPNKGQFMWNVNTCLAYGAKGISYFPLIQPASFAELKDGTFNFSRNGLIGAGETNGEPTKNKWYGYAQEANAQIAAIDDVLMQSVNKGVIITSEKAEADNQYSTCILEGTSWREMKNITGDEIDVMVGCFNYQGKSAFYVVNYDMTTSQDIKMEFDANYQFRVIQNAEISRHRAGSLELSLEAGEGVLVVME